MAVLPSREAQSFPVCLRKRAVQTVGLHLDWKATAIRESWEMVLLPEGNRPCIHRKTSHSQDKSY